MLSEIPVELQSTCQSLRHILTATYGKEAAATEERIRNYTTEQHMALEAFRERLFTEEKALIQ